MSFGKLLILLRFQLSACLFLTVQSVSGQGLRMKQTPLGQGKTGRQVKTAADRPSLMIREIDSPLWKARVQHDARQQALKLPRK